MDGTSSKTISVGIDDDNNNEEYSVSPASYNSHGKAMQFDYGSIVGTRTIGYWGCSHVTTGHCVWPGSSARIGDSLIIHLSNG